jgi:uncharacterized protein (TIGR02246 family)
MVRAGLLALLVSVATPALADATADARGHAEAFARAWNAGSAEDVLALYADDATVVWPGRGEEAHGRQQIAKLLARAFEETKDRRLVVRTLDVTPLGADQLATAGHWQVAFTAADGRRVTSEVRRTEVLVKIDGAWRAVVDHASVCTAEPRPAARRQRRER